MAIDHTGHDHPATPAGRAACRKAQAGTPVPKGVLVGKSQRKCNCGDVDMKTLIHSRKCPLSPKTEDRKPTSIQADIDHTHGRTKPRVKSGKGPMRGATNIKKPGTVLRTIGDLPDVPRMLAYGARLAWANDWPVKVSNPFNDNESRIVIDAPAGEIALVWRPSLPDGVWGVFFRPGYNSVTHRLDSVQEAFELGTGITD